MPPLAEQHRIVAKVDELMALCDRLEAQQADAESAHSQLVQALLDSLTQASDATAFAANWQRLAEHFHTLFTTEPSIDALKQTLLQLAVMGKLVPQDPNDEPASELLRRIAEERESCVAGRRSAKHTALPSTDDTEKTFELPSGWEWVRLQQIISVSSGDGLVSANMKVEGGIPVYGGNGVTGYHDKKNIDKATLVIGRVGYYCGSIHLTPASAWITDNALIVSFSEENLYKNFLFWLLKGTNLKEQENATAQPVISGRKIYPIVLAIPPLAEQHRIVAKVDQLMALCDQLKTSLTQARQLNEQLASTMIEQAVA
ncbi:EcoKI restriction-modification system protein HsdS [compost metagenome]